MPRMNPRQLWAAKLAGRPLPATQRPAALLSGAVAPPRQPFTGRILGIDPSLRGTGLALLELAPGRPPLLLRCRTVTVPARQPLAFALGEIHRHVSEFLEGAGVRHVALEQTIYVQNFQTAQILGAARGSAIAAAAIRDLPVFEYAPLRVKQAVVGAGRASKKQMARTVMAILGHGRALAF
ncbi:MAG: crossover junction endodeoxyribonuclease RuvC, partial [Verrucomicrobia bacterium]|nr:crossover junction endodeoxyribonuclease RuvC [Verrucomicrobiota bacterium]